jgi:Tol biopolymer transport system component
MLTPMIGVVLAMLFATPPPATPPRTVVPAESEESSWSPDGKRLAFDSKRGGKSFNVYVMELATANVTRVTNSKANDCRFSLATKEKVQKRAVYCPAREGRRPLARSFRG